MEAHVMKFLKKDKNIRFILKTGKSILMKYDDVTKSMSQDERDKLTEYSISFTLHDL